MGRNQYPELGRLASVGRVEYWGELRVGIDLGGLLEGNRGRGSVGGQSYQGGGGDSWRIIK